jgi:uncharacterized protein (DUF488 family)
MSKRSRVYSIGYEGRSLEEFCAVLAKSDVEALVDVRLTPWSRRRGFSGSQLNVALSAVGVRYLHEPLLGNPKENREAFWNGDLERGRKRFRERLNNGSRVALESLAELVSRSPTAILCFEQAEERCHRQVIIDALVESLPDLAVTRL